MAATNNSKPLSGSMMQEHIEIHTLSTWYKRESKPLTKLKTKFTKNIHPEPEPFRRLYIYSEKISRKTYYKRYDTIQQYLKMHQ